MMGLQFILTNDQREQFEETFSAMIDNIEVFEISETFFGLSLPEKIIQSVGEDVVKQQIDLFYHYDLWGGKWK